MTPRKLYGDPTLVNQIVSRLTSSDKSDNDSIRYTDNQTNESWLKYEVKSMYIGEPITNLIRLPEPTTSELIDISFSSEYDDEVIAASLRLRDNELFKGQEFREDLLNKIIKIDKKKLDEGQKTRLKTIILLTELAHGENRREITGKQLNDIKADSDFFMMIAYKAEEVLETLE